MAQQYRTHHRRQGQRHEPGYQHGAGQGQSKFDEQLADTAGHEGHRGIHGSQGERHRHHGKTDFLRALECRFTPRHAFLDVAVDVFQHHDCVIHHQTDGQHESQQGQGIDGETEHEHQREGADQRHRYGHQRNEGGAQIAQEEENDRQHQQDGFADGGEHGLDRTVDEDRGVVGNIHAHARRQFRADARQFRVHGLRQFKRIGRRLFDDSQRNRRPPLETHRTALAGGADFHLRHIADAHRIAVDSTHHDGGKLFRGAQISRRHHGKFTRRTFDAPGGHFHILPAQCLLDIRRRQAISRQTLLVEPDAHGEFAFAEHPHVRRAGQCLQAGFDETVGDIGDFERRMAVGRKRHPDDGVGIRFHFGDDWLIDLVRQLVTHPRHPVAHVGSGRIRLPLQLETH